MPCRRTDDASSPRWTARARPAGLCACSLHSPARPVVSNVFGPSSILATGEDARRRPSLATVQCRTCPTVPEAEPGRNVFTTWSLVARARLGSRRSVAMLSWALTFLIVALIAAVLGFGGIAGFAVEIAKIIFFVAIILFLISAVVGLVRGRSPTVP